MSRLWRTCSLSYSRSRQPIRLYDGERFFDASQNAQLVANAERYYRVMYYGSRASWNLRDSHMFDTLLNVLDFHGPDSKAVVWAHNSHIGNAAATEMGRRGEHNIGQLCRQHFGAGSYHIGFGTNDGTVAAASDWDGPMQVMNVRPAHPQSYERLFHMTNAPGLLLPLKEGPHEELRDKLAKPRLERAIGVIYRPESELASHYFEAVLPRQFDEYIWIDRTSAVTPLTWPSFRACRTLILLVCRKGRSRGLPAHPHREFRGHEELLSHVLGNRLRHRL